MTTVAVRHASLLSDNRLYTIGLMLFGNIQPENLNQLIHITDVCLLNNMSAFVVLCYAALRKKGEGRCMSKKNKSLSYHHLKNIGLVCSSVHCTVLFRIRYRTATIDTCAVTHCYHSQKTQIVDFNRSQYIIVVSHTPSMKRDVYPETNKNPDT